MNPTALAAAFAAAGIGLVIIANRPAGSKLSIPGITMMPGGGSCGCGSCRDPGGNNTSYTHNTVTGGAGYAGGVWQD